MKNLYSIILLAVVCLPSSLWAQDTLRHYDLFDEGVQSPLETQAQPNPWGYRYGHGAFGLHEFAEKYTVSESMYVKGVLILIDDIFFGVNSSDSAQVSIYGQASNGKPQSSSMYSTNYAMSDLNSGMATPTIVMFSSDVEVSDSFFAAFGFPTYDFNTSSPNYTPTDDTVGIYVTYSRANSPHPNVYWSNAVRYPSGNWENTEFILGDRLNFCIAPIVSTEGSGTGLAEFAYGNSGLKVKSVFPNPVVDHTTIKLYSARTQRASISVFNLEGKQLVNESKMLIAGDQQIQLELSHLESGQYIALIRTEEGMNSVNLLKQ